MSLRVRKISKRFGGRPVVQEVSFQVADGELVALLGPSGSGKSTILRIVAGLAPCDSGEVEVDGIDVTEEPPQRRDLGFVFQNYALFEHMTVAENIEFALRVRGVDRGERARRRDELLEQVGLGGSARKLPAQLSGGQRQRTALARALAHRPRLLLLDEPFGALDAQIRQELRHGLRTLLKDLGTTAIFVTHDQEEAFAVADRILVLHRGRLLEQGPPEELYHSPRTEFVARFVGRANVLPGELTPLGVRARIGRRPSPDALPQRVKVLYRPERLRLAIPDGASPPPGYELISSEAEVRHIEYLGASERIELAITSQDDEAMVPELVVNVVRGVDQRSDPRLHLGQRVAVHGTRPHAITSPSLRVLVVVDGSDAGRHLLSQALEFGERQHAVLTVIGDGLSRGG
jgi:sulfate transport system ATP-binding protein